MVEHDAEARVHARRGPLVSRLGIRPLAPAAAVDRRSYRHGVIDAKWLCGGTRPARGARTEERVVMAALLWLVVAALDAGLVVWGARRDFSTAVQAAFAVFAFGMFLTELLKGKS